LPDNILIVGAGYVGIEIACLLRNFGKKVTVIEIARQILPGFDSQLARRLETILKRQGIVIDTGVDALKVNLDQFDLVVEALGRVPNLDSLKIKKANLETDKDGWLKTDKYLRSSQKHIYACGDVLGRKLLAYTAEYQGRLCVENIIGQRATEDYSGLPECVFSQPQLAKVGILEEEAKAKGINFKVVKSNFLKFSSSYVYGDRDGFIKFLIDDQEKIIGAGIISKSAAELISIFSLCIKNNLSAKDLKKCIFIHPTLSEILPLSLE